MTDCEDGVLVGSPARTTIPVGFESYAALLAESQFDFDAQRQTPVADGDPSGTWEDFGPNGYDAGAGSQILYRAVGNGINSFPSFEKQGGPPSGVSMPEAADNIGLPTDGFTIFVVREGAAAGQQLIGKWTGPTGRHWRLGTGGNTGVQTLNDVVDADEICANVDDGDARIEMLRWEPGVLTAIYKNGVLQNSAVTPAASCEIGPNNIEIFVDGNANSYTGMIGQVIVFSPFLSVAQINTVLLGLSSAWSIDITIL